MAKTKDPELQRKIEEFKEKANRPHVLDSDVEKLLKSCGGSVELAVKTMKR